MSERALRVAIVGCGNISGAYGETMSAYPSVRIAGATDVDRSLSAAFVDRFGGVDYPPSTTPRRPERRRRRESHLPGRPRRRDERSPERGQARAQREASGRDYRAARSLVELAAERGLRLHARRSRSWERRSRRCGGSSSRARSAGCASRTPRPTGAGSRAGTGARALLSHRPVRRHGRVSAHDSHRNIRAERRVTAFGTIVHPDRTTMDGESFTPEAPDFGVSVSNSRTERSCASPQTSTSRANEAGRDRAPRRLGLDPPFRLAALRRHGRARAFGEPYTPSPSRGRSPAPTGDGPSAT